MDGDRERGAPDAPGVMRGWLNELVLVPAIALALWAPLALVVVLAGRLVHPALGHTEPLGRTVLLVGLLGAYAFAVFRVRGRHARLHRRYP